MRGGKVRAPRWALLICVAAALAGTAAGCGSDSDGGDTTAAQSAKTTTVDPVRQAKLMKTGRKVFFEHCHSCHTMLGRKHSKPVIEFEAPDFDEVQLPKPAYIRERVLTGGIGMQSFQGELSEFEIDAIIEFIGATAGRNVDDATADARPASQLEAGKQIFAEQCAECHGIAGKPGTGRPSYGGTDFNNVKPSQAFAIRKTLEGLEGAMPSFRGRLKRPELHAVAAYVASVAAEDPAEAGD